VHQSTSRGRVWLGDSGILYAGGPRAAKILTVPVSKEGHGKATYYTAAFAAYGAQLKNKQWAFSAIANDGALVWLLASPHPILWMAIRGRRFAYPDGSVPNTARS
jgi:hypothetical protein